MDKQLRSQISGFLALNSVKDLIAGRVVFNDARRYNETRRPGSTFHWEPAVWIEIAGQSFAEYATVLSTDLVSGEVEFHAWSGHRYTRTANPTQLRILTRVMVVKDSPSKHPLDSDCDVVDVVLYDGALPEDERQSQLVQLATEMTLGEDDDKTYWFKAGQEYTITFSNPLVSTGYSIATTTTSADPLIQVVTNNKTTSKP